MSVESVRSPMVSSFVCVESVREVSAGPMASISPLPTLNHGLGYLSKLHLKRNQSLFNL